jgi:hypothetical protein
VIQAVKTFNASKNGIYQPIILFDAKNYNFGPLAEPARQHISSKKRTPAWTNPVDDFAVPAQAVFSHVAQL